MSKQAGVEKQLEKSSLTVKPKALQRRQSLSLFIGLGKFKKEMALLMDQKNLVYLARRIYIRYSSGLALLFHLQRKTNSISVNWIVQQDKKCIRPGDPCPVFFLCFLQCAFSVPYLAFFSRADRLRQDLDHLPTWLLLQNLIKIFENMECKPIVGFAPM